MNGFKKLPSGFFCSATSMNCRAATPKRGRGRFIFCGRQTGPFTRYLLVSRTLSAGEIPTPITGKG
jgi:hypothetical protein